jgi:hypothetical protein
LNKEIDEAANLQRQVDSADIDDVKLRDLQRIVSEAAAAKPAPRTEPMVLELLHRPAQLAFG